jgi:hypothetical protein
MFVSAKGMVPDTGWLARLWPLPAIPAVRFRSCPANGRLQRRQTTPRRVEGSKLWRRFLAECAGLVWPLAERPTFARKPRKMNRTRRQAA